MATVLVCTKVWPSAFDELEHLSYAAYLQESGNILPHIEDMRTLVPADLSRWDDRANYLGHPSPYYLYIAPFLDRTLPSGRAILLPRFAVRSTGRTGASPSPWSPPAASSSGANSPTRWPC